MNSNSNIAANVDFTCVRGDTFSRQLKFWSDDAKTVPADISAWTFRMQVKPANGSTPVLSFTMSAGFSIESPNILNMQKTAAEMKDLQPGKLRYDIEKTVDGKITTIMTGTFTIENDYTI